MAPPPTYFVLCTFHQLKGDLAQRQSASEVHRTAVMVVAKGKLASYHTGKGRTEGNAGERKYIREKRI
jgi:hypothetical protein